MPEAVPCFDGVLAGEIVGGVAIVAGGNGAVAAFKPAIILLVHYMAVSARGRIVAQVRISLPVPEGVYPDADGQPETYTENHQFEDLQIHAGNCLSIIMRQYRIR
jgi:hypothetical protein